MERPKITPGTWTIEQKNPYTTEVASLVSAGNDLATFYKYGFDDHTEHDAQAISAVPEMIDALIAINESDQARKSMGSVARSKMIKALKKAGVKMEVENATS